jgi:hypothetical protein
MLFSHKTQSNKENSSNKDVSGVLRTRTRTLCGFGSIIFALLILYLTGPVGYVLGQGSSGYTKVNTSIITASTFTTPTLTDGVAYNFEVTGVNSAGVESGPSNIVTAIVPATGTHTATITWTPGSNDVTFNVYAQVVASANPPSAVQVVIN